MHATICKLSATILWKKQGKNPCFCGKSMENINASFKIISYNFVEKARKKTHAFVEMLTFDWFKTF